MSSSNSSVASPRIAILGGGIAGLAATHRLRELLPNARITVFESASRLGGVLETVQRDGFLIERSADNFLTRDPGIIELCQRLGIAQELIPTEESRRRAFVVRNGRLHPIPDGFFLMSPRRLWPLLTSPLLSPLGKMRVLAEPLVPRGRVSTILDTEPDPLVVPDESVASFAKRRFGRQLLERVIQPLVGGIYSADPARLSMAATLPEFLNQEQTYGSLLNAARHVRRDRLESKDAASDASGARYSLFVAPKHGISSLVSALAASLPPDSICLNTRVLNVRRTSTGGWLLSFEIGGSTQSTTGNHASHFDALIVALPAFVAADVLRNVGATLAAELTAIEYAGCNVVSLGFRRDQLSRGLDGFGLVVPRVENRRIIAASFASQKFPGRAPEDSVLIRTFIGGALQPQLVELPDHELLHIAQEELASLLGVRGGPIVADIARWPRSMPQYHVGHLSRVARIERFVAELPRLALAGNAYSGVGIPQCIRSGELAAARIADQLTDSNRTTR